MSDDLTGSVSCRAAVLSVAAFWAFYFLVATARALIGGETGQVLMLLPRLVVSLASAVATALILLLLRRQINSALRVLVGLAMLASAPAAGLYGATNWYMFDRMLPSFRSPLHDQTLRSGITVGAPPANERRPPIADIADTAMNGYFLFVAWCALYLALNYAAQLGALERRTAILREAAQAAELRALRYQVNPHFLFNTMNSLSSLVMAGRAVEAERMIVGLCAFFRESLTGDPTQDVMLGDEIELQKLYLEIEKVRFGNRLNVVIDVPSDLASAYVPGLILQPLVENVIKHALSHTHRIITLRIEARVDAGMLALGVSDDGKMNELCDAPQDGVGLANVRNRVAARFGEDGAVFCRRTGDGFFVTLALPLIRHGG